MSPAPPTTPPCPRSDRAAPTMTTRPPGHRPGGRVVVTPRGNPYETRLRRRDRSGHRSTALRPSAVEAFRLTGRRRGQCWPRGMALIRASFVQTLSRRPERKPVRFTSYPATTRMRRSRSNVLHSARESAYTAGQQHSLPPHTRKVAGSIRRRPQSFMPRRTAVLLSPFIHRQCLRTDRNHPRPIGLTSGQSIWRTRINEKVRALLGFGYP